VTLESTGSRRSLSATCSASGQTLTLGTRCEGRLMPHSGGFDLVALVVGCALKSDNLSTALSERCTHNLVYHVGLRFGPDRLVPYFRAPARAATTEIMTARLDANNVHTPACELSTRSINNSRMERTYWRSQNVIMTSPTNM
jgi:hypothetical protein